MYAVIRAGGRQLKVSEGDVIEVDYLRGASGRVEFTPLLIVGDDGATRAGRAELGRAKVTGEVVGETKGPKIDVDKYRSKTGYRRHTGHRQRYTSVRIAQIGTGTRSRKSKKETEGVTEDGA
jgi:large subunit ribosomal protein L21